LATKIHLSTNACFADFSYSSNCLYKVSYVHLGKIKFETMIRQFRLFLPGFLFFAFGFSMLHAQKISSDLYNGVNTEDVLVCFKPAENIQQARWIKGKNAKAQFVYDQLTAHAARSQEQAIAILRQTDLSANSLFLVNAIAIRDLDLATARKLAALPEVTGISMDPWVYFDEPMNESTIGERNAIEWGVERIQAPAVWAMGYTGQGITVGGADTGYEWFHPAIKNKYRGYDEVMDVANHNYHWHDAIHELSPLNNDSLPDPSNNPCGLDSPVPCDDHNHGTHTMGTMVGDDDMGNQIGVAPNAKWVACRNMERGWGKPSSYLECMQWFLAPTDIAGENADPAMAPHVINNSWYCAVEEGCTDLSIHNLLRDAVFNLKLSGVVVIVSNGNFGPACETTYGPPAYFQESYSIGSFRFNDTISGFSSRGPVTIDSSFIVKPNVVAPGSNVRSCIRNGGYANFSGTSMAGPHAVGLVALILSARPDLAGDVEAIENILTLTALPTVGLTDCSDNNGMDYPNNTYGYGRIDAMLAIGMAVDWGSSEEALQNKPHISVSPNPASTQFYLRTTNLSGPQQLRIYNSDGREVLFEKIQLGTGVNTLEVLLPTVPPGVYFVQLQGQNSLISENFIL
jgi:hypothetical protein